MPATLAVACGLASGGTGRFDAAAAARQHATMRLGTCYYPEHWPEDWWADDAARMIDMGLTRVRIGEFAWSRIEPEPGRFDWAWLDRAVETLHNAGLGIIMGTPTATPPKWLVDAMPDMLGVDADGQPRKFGSRRHYCFSHRRYRAECARIVTAMAERYGAHPAIVAWQTDNEYGCHDTAISYSDAACHAFRDWLAAKYADIGALNTAWGNVFWSMEYRSFGEIELPNLTVTEPNPAHILDFRRFASDEVVGFNRLQCDILRERSPGRDIVHNFMGFFTQFDHHAIARDLDVVTWDSYPLGFLDSFAMFTADEKARYARQGHPDIAAFHHDLYRGMAPKNDKGVGRWAVMEQQPGPVNWSRHNPAPLPGMVRLWTLEAMAHGAELVSYFRWRQAPFGQEQMHSGLHRPDRVEDIGGAEVRSLSRHPGLDPGSRLTVVRTEEEKSGTPGQVWGDAEAVALLFSYEAEWVIDTQPQGASFNYLDLAFTFYSALRRAGLNIDIVSPDADLCAYAMIVAPTLPILSDALADKLAALGVPVLLGPRTGSKTADFAIPPELAPGALQRHLPIKIVRVESRDPAHGEPRWVEHIESDLTPEGPVWQQGRIRYLSVWPDAALLDRLVGQMADEAGISALALPRDVRIRRNGDAVFAFNYGNASVDFAGQTLPAAGVAIWRNE